MPQRIVQYPKAVYSENKTLYVSAGETIALEDIPSIGHNRFAVTISNSSLSADPITIVNIYGSEDKLNYYLYKPNIFSGGIGPNATMHYEFTAMTHYLKVTAQSAGLSNIDIFLIGNAGSTATSTSGSGATPGTPGTGTVQSGLIQFINTDTASVTLTLPYLDTNYAITLTCGDNVLPYYDETSKTGTGFTVYTSAPFTGEVSYEVAHP